MKRKNVLMIFTDQQRADTIHALGNDNIVTPALDSIASEAVVFDRMTPIELEFRQVEAAEQ